MDTERTYRLKQLLEAEESTPLQQAKDPSTKPARLFQLLGWARPIRLAALANPNLDLADPAVQKVVRQGDAPISSAITAILQNPALPMISLMNPDFSLLSFVDHPESVVTAPMIHHWFAHPTHTYRFTRYRKQLMQERGYANDTTPDTLLEYPYHIWVWIDDSNDWTVMTPAQVDNHIYWLHDENYVGDPVNLDQMLRHAD